MDLAQYMVAHMCCQKNSSYWQKNQFAICSGETKFTSGKFSVLPKKLPGHVEIYNFHDDVFCQICLLV